MFGRLSFSDMMVASMLTILALILVLIPFNILGFVTINVEKQYFDEYQSCLGEKQITQDKLNYCNDVKGIQDNTPGAFLFVITLIVWIVGVGFMVYHITKSKVVDDKEKELEKKQIQLDDREIHLTQREKELNKKSGRK